MDHKALRMKKIVVVYNKKSGSTESRQQISDYFSAANLVVTTFIPIGSSLKNDLHPYLNKQTIVAAIGGDGTISAVASLLINTKATLAVLPGGTLNNFSKDLGVNQKISTAISDLPTNIPTTVDTARVNDTTFINNSSIGLYPQSLNSRKRTEDRLGKWPAAAIGMLRVLIRFRTYRVTIDGRSFDTPFIFVGNNDYNLEDLSDTRRASLTEGVLSVYIVKSSRRYDLLRIFFAALRRKLHTIDELTIHRPTRLTIETKYPRRISISHDGEVSRAQTPITYTVQPRSLIVLTPKQPLNNREQ